MLRFDSFIHTLSLSIVLLLVCVNIKFSRIVDKFRGDKQTTITLNLAVESPYTWHAYNTHMTTVEFSVVIKLALFCIIKSTYTCIHAAIPNVKVYFSDFFSITHGYSLAVDVIFFLSSFVPKTYLFAFFSSSLLLFLIV